MLAKLYIHQDAFAYNGVDSKEQVISKLCSFTDDMRSIIYEHYDENEFYVSSEVLICEVFEGITFVDFIGEFLDGDQKGIMYTILANTSEEYSYTLLELLDKSRFRPEEKEVQTIVFFNKPLDERDDRRYMQFDSYEIVYNKNSWITLRRQILGNHPENPSFFVQECKKYFKDLAIHANCEESLIDDEYNYLEIIPRRIVYYLSCLNDGFKEVRKSHLDRAQDPNSILEDFSGHFGLDRPGSIEGDLRKRPQLTFDFATNDGGRRDMVCEPHLKITQTDSNCTYTVNYSTFNPRIYFNFGEESVEGGKILVGSIGKHVS